MTRIFGERPASEILNDAFGGYNTGTADFAATPVAAPLDAEDFASSANYSLASHEVTITEEDRYAVEFAVACTVLSSARTQGRAYLERNGSEVPGSAVLLYCRQTGHGASGSCKKYLDLNAGDTLCVRGVRTAGSGTLQFYAGGNRLTIRRL